MDAGSTKNNVNILENIAVAMLVFYVLATLAFTLWAVIEGVWMYFVIGLGVLFNGILLYYFLLVFCGMAKNIYSINYALVHQKKTNDVVIATNKQPLEKSPDTIKEASKHNVSDSSEEVINEKFVINGEFVSLRSGPSNNDEFLSKLSKGTVVDVVKEERKSTKLYPSPWVQVQTKDGVIGWVNGIYISKI